MLIPLNRGNKKHDGTTHRGFGERIRCEWKAGLRRFVQIRQNEQLTPGTLFVVIALP
jgi:hypothetical protein